MRFTVADEVHLIVEWIRDGQHLSAIHDEMNRSLRLTTLTSRWVLRSGSDIKPLEIGSKFSVSSQKLSEKEIWNEVALSSVGDCWKENFRHAAVFSCSPLPIPFNGHLQVQQVHCE